MLFAKYALNALLLKNRIVMPPMTRSRAGAGDVANDMMADYYAQRASAGLIISEGTQISQQGQGYAWTPGIYSEAQIAGWKKVIDAVHHAGGKIFAQLWHVGRMSHTMLQPNGAAPVPSSAIGKERVGIRLAPLTMLMGSRDDTPVMPAAFKEALRIIFHGTLIYSGKYTKARAEEALANGWADLIGFGRLFIANPDLPHRLENDLPLNAPIKEKFFGGGKDGYLNYPFL